MQYKVVGFIFNMQAIEEIYVTCYPLTYQPLYALYFFFLVFDKIVVNQKTS